MSQRSTSIFTNFTSGEISPTAGARIDLAQYNNAARIIENGVVMAQGGVEKRPGTYYVAPTKFSGKKARLIPFKYNYNQEYMLEFGERYVRFFANGGIVTPNITGPQMLITGVANNGSGLIRITCANHGFITNDTVIIANVPGTTEANGTWVVTVITPNTFDLVASVFVHAYTLPSPPELVTNGGFATDILGWSYEVISAFVSSVAGGQSGNCLQIYSFFNGYVWQQISGLIIGNTYTFSLYVKAIDSTNAYQVGIGGLDSDPKSFIVSRSGTATGSWVLVTFTWVCTQSEISTLLYPSSNLKVDTVSLKTAVAYGGTASKNLAEIVTPYAEADIFNIDYAQSGDMLYLAHPNYPPAILSRYPGEVWKYSAVSFTYGESPVLSAGPGIGGAVRITAINHGLMSGDIVSVSGIVGVTSANGVFTINVIDIDHFDLIGSTLPGLPVTGAVNTGGIIQLTVVGHGLITGDIVTIGGINGTIEANGVWAITYVDIDNFTLQNSNFVNPYTDGGWCSESSSYGYISGGSITSIQKITAIAGNGAGAIRITEVGHGFYSGQGVTISGVTGTTEANGIWEITVIDDNTYDLVGSIFAHTYVSGGYAVPNIFATPDNYPAAICFFEQRLCWGGSYNQPQTIWLSVVADYLNLIMGSNTDDAMEYTLAMSGIDVISWMVPWNYMLIGAPDGEWRFGGSSAGSPVSPTSVIAKIQSNIGSSSDVKATMLGDIAVFQQYYGTKLFQMGYNFITDSFTVDELTKLATHILKPSISQMAVHQTPETVLYMVRTDGQLVVMTFYKDEKVIAFSRIVSPGGSGTDTIESCAVIHGIYEDELWVIVNRTLNGVAVRCVEYFTPRDFLVGLPTPRVQAYPFSYADCALTFNGGAPQPITGATNTKPVVITYTGTPPANGQYVRIKDVEGMTELNQNGLLVANLNTTNKTFEVMIDGIGFGTYESGGTYMRVTKIVSGATHLIGELVDICADGAMLTPQTVPATGILTFRNYYNIITVGLHYAMTIKPQYPEINVATGTSAGVQKQIEKVSVRLYNTIGLKVGEDENALQEIIFDPNIYDADHEWNDELFTGDKEIEFLGGVKTKADMVIVHDYPLPCCVLGIMTLLTVLDR